ncbi:TlpA family protein disulfide reductase [Micromonospora sp. MS34]|uniref:TlpA family protein disulfide reductase n=1 Tax=Micromonospora sp. MS34 TaxID=3385971 RepID=UPI0039A1B380
MLVFSTSWCTRCAQRQDALSELARAHRDEVVFVGVATEDKLRDVQRYLREHRVGYPVVADDDGAIWRSYAVREPRPWCWWPRAGRCCGAGRAGWTRHPRRQVA